MKGSKDVTSEFLEVYDQLSDSLFRHCQYKISNREKALDLVQEAFTRTWEYLASGKRIENMKSFVYRTTNNLIIDEYRRKRAESLDLLAEAGFDPKVEGDVYDPAHTSEVKLTIEAVKNLPHLYREAIELRYIDGLSIGEIAALLQISANVVSVRLTRGVEKLKDVLHI